MTHTTNYNLSQWDAGDRILRDDFNADNAKIDAELAAAAGSIANLASVKGNCRIETFTYVGKGTSDTDSPTVVRFSAMPTLYFILGPSFLAGVGGASNANVHYNYRGAANVTTNTAWSGNTLRITGTSEYTQCSCKDLTYFVVALYAQDAA